MTSATRLRVSLVIIIVSAIYGVTVAEDPQLAHSLAMGYVVVLLTVLLILNLWKRP